MTSGGARTHSGPLPEMNALKRQYDAKTFTRLPRDCSLPIPDWPIEIDEPTVQELGYWAKLWRRPQGHIWHLEQQHDAVALYVRNYIEAGRPNASSLKRTAVRQMAEMLYLTGPAMRAHKYVIVDSPEDEILGELQMRLAATGTDGAPASSNRGGRRATGVRSSARERSNVQMIRGGETPDALDDDDDTSDDVE